MPKRRGLGGSSLAGLEAERRKNLRQLLLGAGRAVHRDVVEGLRAKGYPDLRSTHTTLLSNLPLAGATVTEVAERASITKQAMGRLADELVEAGYLQEEAHAGDRRARRLTFTPSGNLLMLDSFKVMAALHRKYERALGRELMEATMRGLAMLGELDGDVAE